MSDELTADFHHEILDAIIGGGFEGGAVRGLMEYYPDSGSVNEKVRALSIDVDEIGGKSWCVTTMELTEPLTPDELDAVKAYLVSLYSGSLGRNIEPIKIEIEQVGAIYINLWSSGNDFSILMEQEFIQRFEQEKSAYNAIPTTTEKLYSPLDFYIWNADSTTTWQEEVQPKTALQFKSDIDVFMSENRQRYDTYDNYKGLMNYAGADSFADKVHSVFPAVEEHNGRLWLATSVRLTEPLTPQETADLKYWWVKEINDGWGGQVNQHEINTNLGEMTLDPQTEGTEFFIDTEREFKNRLENETPAQAALYEPDFSEDVETAELMQKLIDRVDKNFADYFDGKRLMAGDVIINWTAELATMSEAHYYVMNHHNFHKSELDYLLKFQNSLKVVAAEFDKNRDGNLSERMWNIFHEQDALKNGRHEPVQKESDALTAESLINRLFDRIDNNNTGYLLTVSDDSDYYFPNAVHIERDDSMMKYANDTEAAKAAELDGVKLIYGMKNVADGVYVDTPENRQTIINALETGRLNVNESGLTGLIQKFRERADQNWEDYRHAPHETTPDNLFHISMQIVSRRDAAVFIKEYDGFTAEQLNCLLQFANPVELIGDYLDKASDISEMPGILANILEEQENFKKHYALMPEEKTSGFEESKQQLIERLAENYSVYKRDMMDMGKEGIFYAAAEILPVQEAYAYFTQEHDFIESDIDFLLKFENPLELISDKWSDRMNITKTIDAIFSDKERTLKNGGYTLVSDDTASTASKPSRNAVGDDDKFSVIDRIRQAEKDAKERASTPKDKSKHNKSEEL